MSEKIEINVADVENQLSKLKDVIPQASYFEKKYPDDESLVDVFENIEAVVNYFNDVTMVKKSLKNIPAKLSKGLDDAK